MGLIRLAAVILLPMLPAYVLFKALPSTGNVDGKLQGMEIKLGGAFGGYFAVLILIFAQWGKIVPPPPPTSQAWEVDGQLNDDTGNGIPVVSADDFKSDPGFINWGGGYFRIFIHTTPGDDGKPRFSPLMITPKGFGTVPIHLEDPSAVGETGGRQGRSSTAKHLITLNPLKFHRVADTPYNDKAQSPSPVASLLSDRGGHQ